MPQIRLGVYPRCEPHLLNVSKEGAVLRVILVVGTGSISSLRLDECLAEDHSTRLDFTVMDGGCRISHSLDDLALDAAEANALTVEHDTFLPPRIDGTSRVEREGHRQNTQEALHVPLDVAIDPEQVGCL